MTHQARCISNLFYRETEPDWVQELSVDIKEECQQYGTVEHIFVNPESLVSNSRR